MFKTKITAFYFLLTFFLIQGGVIAQEPGYELEVAGCDNWPALHAGELVTFQHGIGFGSYEDAVAERAGQQAFFTIDGQPLEPVYYEGLTAHEVGFYGDRARANWNAVSGRHTVTSYWTHPNEADADSCTFRVGRVIANETPDSSPVVIYHAGSDWTASDIILQEGDHFIINVSGQMNIWVACPWMKDDVGLPDFDCTSMIIGPDGAEGFEPAPDAPLQEGNTAAVIARIEDDPPFLVGAGGHFIASRAGQIEFRMNEANWAIAKDVGTFIIRIEVNP